MKPGHTLFHPDQELRQVLPLHDFRRGNAEPVVHPTPQTPGHVIQSCEKWLYIGEEDLPLPRELERSPPKQGDTEVVLQLQNLCADGWLLDAVGDVPGGRAHPAMPGHVEKQLKMVDVHARSVWGWPTVFSPSIHGQTLSISIRRHPVPD